MSRWNHSKKYKATDSWITSPLVLEVTSSVLLTHVDFLREKVSPCRDSHSYVQMSASIQVGPGMSLTTRHKLKAFCKDSITTASKQPRMNKNIKFSPIAKKDVHCHKLITTEVWMGGARCWEAVLRHFSLLHGSQIQQWQFAYQSTQMPTCTAGDIWLLVFMCPDASSSTSSTKRAAVRSSKHYTPAQKWAFRCYAPSAGQKTILPPLWQRYKRQLNRHLKVQNEPENSVASFPVKNKPILVNPRNKSF